ncbi:MAG: MinD/ParA family ATP-binding protein [Burkholderiales bacterium]
MANFSLDQAEGLRRMLSEPKPRIVTLLSTQSAGEKNAMLTNLTATLMQMGSDTVLVDARRTNGVGLHLNMQRKKGLLEVARQQCALSDVIQALPQGYSVVAMSGERAARVRDDETENQRLSKVFSVLAQQYGTMLVDGELDGDDRLPVAALDDGTIVIHLTSDAESIKSAYCLIKRLSAVLGRRSFGILVTQCEEAQGRLVYANLAQTANRYLAVSLHFMGSIPADDHLSRAARLGRSVIEAFPLALASVAFRRIAGQLD